MHVQLKHLIAFPTHDEEPVVYRISSRIPIKQIIAGAAGAAGILGADARATAPFITSPTTEAEFFAANPELIE